MHRRLFLSLALVAAGAIASPALAQRPDPDVKALVDGNSEFGLALYQHLAAKDQGNLFLSPYSISNAFGMCYAGARGNTAAEMKATLRFPHGDERLHAAFGKLIEQLHGAGDDRPFQLTIDNRLWGQRDYGFLPEFLRISGERYGAGLEEVDFVRSAEAARVQINRWVEEQTRDKIKDLVPPGVLDDMTRLVLTNAIYFKAPWATPFDERRTRPGDFHLSSGQTVQAAMMQQNGCFGSA